MERYLALDVGEKYIGVAVSDVLGVIAQGVCTIVRDDHMTEYNKLSELIKKYDINTIVVGMPNHLDGNYTKSSKLVEDFSQDLIDRFGVKIHYQDERLTSIAAESILIEGKIRRENRKDYIDKIAATLILQTFLDSKTYLKK